MKKILNKIERIRLRGRATLKLNRDSAFFCYNGNTFDLDSISSPGYNCKATVIIKGKKVQFSINEIL